MNLLNAYILFTVIISGTGSGAVQSFGVYDTVRACEAARSEASKISKNKVFSACVQTSKAITVASSNLD